MNTPAFGEKHAVVFHPRQPARKTRLAIHGFRRHDLGEATREPAIVGLVTQRPVQTRRRHFKGVRVFERSPQLILDIEQRAQVVAHPLAVFDANDLIQPIHHHSQHPPDRFPPELQIEQFQAMALRNSGGSLANAFYCGVAGSAHNWLRTGCNWEKQALKTRKVGTGPLTTAFPLQPYRVYT
jgi:hypothetical protein